MRLMVAKMIGIEYENDNIKEKLAELTGEELQQVTGGAEYIPPRDIFFVKGTSDTDGTHGPKKRLTDEELEQVTGGVDTDQELREKLLSKIGFDHV